MKKVIIRSFKKDKTKQYLFDVRAVSLKSCPAQRVKGRDENRWQLLSDTGGSV